MKFSDSPWGPCPHCPVPEGRSCPARTQPNPRYCELVDPGHPAHDARYRALLVERSGEGPEAARSTPAPAPSRVGTAIEARMQGVYACDYRGPRLGCGCAAVNHCGLGRGPLRSRPFEVSVADCLRCLSATDAAPSGRAR